MAYRIAQQPDGKFSIFSSVVDNFVTTDLTEPEVLSEFLSQAIDDTIARTQKAIAAAKEDAGRYEKCLETIKLIHQQEHPDATGNNG